MSGRPMYVAGHRGLVGSAVWRAAEGRARHVALSHELLALAERISAKAGPDHARRAELVEMAEAAQDRLKHDRLDEAAKAVEALRRVLQ